MKNLSAMLCISLMLAGSACAAARTSGAGVSTDQITEEELRSVAVSNLYEAVQRLRPRWIAVRSQQSFGANTEILVYQNQTRLGGPEVLRNFAPDAAAWMQYLDGPTAAATLPGLGSSQVEGAIVIHTSPRGR